MSTLPTLARADVVLLFHWHYYDGPLEGALEWDGNRYWFSAPFDEDSHEFGQVLELQTLTDEDWIRVDAEQALFEKYVGRHTRYDRDTQRCDLLDQVPHCHEDGHPNPYYDRPREAQAWVPKGSVVATVLMWGSLATPSPEEHAGLSGVALPHQPTPGETT